MHVAGIHEVTGSTQKQTSSYSLSFRCSPFPERCTSSVEHLHTESQIPFGLGPVPLGMGRELWSKPLHCCLGLVSHLHSRDQLACIYLPKDGPCALHEHFLHVLTCQSTCLKEGQLCTKCDTNTCMGVHARQRHMVKCILQHMHTGSTHNGVITLLPTNTE